MVDVISKAMRVGSFHLEVFVGLILSLLRCAPSNLTLQELLL